MYVRSGMRCSNKLFLREIKINKYSYNKKVYENAK